LQWRKHWQVNNKTLIIAAVSATGYAQAAVDGGFDVVTFDLFADADTCKIAKLAFKLNLKEDGIDLDDFKRQFSMLKLEDYAGFLYGGLFDHAPDLLAWIAERVLVIGNTSQILRRVKGFEFFALLSALNIQYPAVKWLKNDTDLLIEQPEKWLVKQLGGTGGLHVKPAIGKGNTGDYLQKKIEGVPISLLFIADGQNAQTIGVNQQFVSGTQALPYRFAGAVSQMVIAEEFKDYLECAAKQLTHSLGLRGCNSLDAIFDGERVWILELNPRLSATFCLYPNLMYAHMQGCNGHLVELPAPASALAQLVIYADKGIKIPVDFIWPSDVMHVPNVEGSVGYLSIAQGEPICTVLATSTTARVATQAVYEKAALLEKRLLEISN
jgi:predicted ATP-grasp superfamily ATP-dependent carboligase